jgi:hypothetical protein
VKTPPSRRDTLPRRQAREADQKRKLPMKTKPACFDTLVARYYCSICSFALRMTGDPLEAVLLTHHAFKSTRKQLRRRRDEAVTVILLLVAVIQGLKARGFN